MRITAVLLAALFVFTAAAPAQAQDKPGKEQTVYPMPDFEVRSLDGQEVDTRKLHGNVVLLDIWATWCGPCIASAPALDRMYQELHGDGLKMFGIAVQSGTADKVRAAARKLGMSYPVILWNKQLAEKIKGVQSVPTYILVNQDWNVEKLFVGATSPALIRTHVEELLRQEESEPRGSQ